MAENPSGKNMKPRASGGGIRRPGQASGKPGTASRRSAVQSETAKSRGSRGQEESSSVPSATKPKPIAKRNKKTKDGSGSIFQKNVRKRGRSMAIIITIAAVLVLVTVFSAVIAYTYMTDINSNPITLENIYLDNDSMVKFRVEKQESTSSISDRLYEMGLIKNKFMYRFLSKFNGYDGMYNAGTYTLSEGLSYDEIMYILAQTPPETIKITFPEGFTTDQIAARLEANDVCTAAEFYEAIETVDIKDYPFLLNIDLSTRDHRLDGYLFPDTYEFDVLAEPEDVIYKMLDRFNAIFKPAYYERLNELGMTLDQVVNMAAMVEREAKLDAERSTISGVFYNRFTYTGSDPGLKKFQSCATLRYVYKKLYDIDLINITEEHQKTDDPYNTYLYEGFTPGPICNPGLKSIEAALYPSNHRYYFFLARTDGSGSHIFNETYAGHLAAQRGQG